MHAEVVRFEAVRWNVADAAELLRDPLRDAPLCKRERDWLRKQFDILLMAGTKADYLETKLKNLVLGNVAFTVPSPVFFGLWGTAGSLTDAFNGGTANEVSGGAYDRVSMTNNTTNFATVTDNVNKVNSVAVTWAQATANWNSSNPLQQVGVLDGNAKTSGDNGLLWADLTVAKTVLNLDTAQFAASGFSWSED